MGFPTIPGARVIENPRRRKYGKVFVGDKFVIEQWYPAEKYGEPEDWVETEYSKTGSLIDYGPYPSRGVYLLIDVVEDAFGNYIEPTKAYCDTVILALDRKTSSSPLADLRTLEQMQERSEGREFNRRLDMIKEANKPSNYHDSWVSYNIPGKKESA